MSSPQTQGASTAPTRGPKAPREQILGDNRAPTWGALQLPKPRPETWDQIQRLSSRIHAFIHALQYKSADAGSRAAPRPCFGLRAPSPFLLSLLPSNPVLLPKGKSLNYEKEQRNEISGLEAPARAPQVPVLVALSPPPPSPARGRRGHIGARGPALLCQNKAHRGSPRPRTEAVTKASGRRRAPSLRSYRGTQRRPRRWGAICTRFFRGGGISLLCTQ